MTARDVLLYPGARSMDYDTTKLAVAGIFGGFALLEVLSGRFLFRESSTRKDVVLDVGATLVVPTLIVYSVLKAAGAAAALLMPESINQFAGWPAWAMFGVLLIADDLTQYWWHRLSHTSWLYPLHRAHHSAPYLSIRVVYRNNLIYYAMMPGLWFSGVLLFLGFAKVYFTYITVKMLVIFGAHSSVPWDTYLLKWPGTRKVMWVIERVISTPATHAAHHGLHEADGITHYRGNYGNLLFFWDVLFGTAKITRQRPDHYGIEGLEPVSWFRELIWPQRERRSVEPHPR